MMGSEGKKMYASVSYKAQEKAAHVKSILLAIQQCWFAISLACRLGFTHDLAKMSQQGRL